MPEINKKNFELNKKCYPYKIHKILLKFINNPKKRKIKCSLGKLMDFIKTAEKSFL
jgi:hypothetical protein